MNAWRELLAEAWSPRYRVLTLVALIVIGAAGAMAAAAVTEAAGGTAVQALDAAAIALQNTMGSVCDSPRSSGR